MDTYYAILHDGPPGPSHLENVVSREHRTVYLDAKMTPTGVVVKPSTDPEFEVTRATGRRRLYVTMWYGPTFLVAMHFVPPSYVNRDNFVRAHLSWTQYFDRSEIVEH